MKKIVLLAFFVVAVLPQTFAAISESDSIRREMKHLKGQQLLQAYSNLCRLAAAGNNANYELRCTREYLAEALRQHDVEAEGLARSSQINCYYNYSMPDSLIAELPKTLAALGKNKTWDYYYNSWNVLVEMYLYQDKLQTALNESQKMYADARQKKSNYGLGVSSYCMGGIYQTMGRYAEAEKSLDESINALSKEEDITLLLSAYNALGETLDGMGKYDKLRTITIKWKSILDQYKKKALAKGYAPSLNGRYLYCTLAAAVAEIETKHYPKAAELLNTAEQLAEGRKAIAQYKLLQVKARYYAAIGNFNKAIDCNSENMKILTAAGDSVSLLTVELQQADFLLSAGRYQEAAKLYHEIIPRKDQLRTTELARQLDELRTIFGVDKLTLKNKIANNRFYFALVASILLLIIVVLYFIYTRRLRHKNRILYDTIIQSQKIEDSLQEQIEQTPDEKLDEEGRIYRKLCLLMQEEHLYKEQDTKREDLAERLGTNHTYLANAVKRYSGSTIAEFINSYRLKHAATLLSGDPSKNISEVECLSGFNSRATFIRLFREQFGMTPSEYRAISKEKKIKAGTTEETTEANK